MGFYILKPSILFILHTVSNSFILQSYLILGYIFCSSDSYDIKWTTPQCVMCLRLIGRYLCQVLKSVHY